MKTLFLTFTHKFENEEYQLINGVQRVLELLQEGFPIRHHFYDEETDIVFIHFGCKGAIIE